MINTYQTAYNQLTGQSIEQNAPSKLKNEQLFIFLKIVYEFEFEPVELYWLTAANYAHFV